MADVLKPEIDKKKVKVSWDTKEFEENLEELKKNFYKNFDSLLVELAQYFVAGAVKATPPSIGKTTIEKRFWTRPILSLALLVRNRYPKYKATKEDYRQYHKKYKYKVLYTRRDLPKNVAYAYTKTKGDARKAAKIETRGLSRVMWGKNLGDIGAKVPNSILKILAKSPKLNSLNFNTVKMIKKDTSRAVEITNSVKDIEDYAKKAEFAGYRVVSRTLQRKLKELSEKKQEV